MASPADGANETIADIVAAGRNRQEIVVSVPGRTTDYGYAAFCADVYKSGNLLRHYGLRADASCAVAVGPKAGDGPAGWPDAADPLLAVLGAGIVGARVDLTPPPAPDGRTFVLPAAWLDRYDPAPGCSVVAYGGPPETPGVAHFERERWSENPVEPPDPADPDAPLVGGVTQRALVSAARSAVDRLGVGSGDRVALRTPLDGPGALAAGLFAPLLAGATVVLAGPDGDEGDVAAVVGPDGDVDPAAVTV